MKVTGFTFIRNAIKFDYPIREAICSILPVCDEVVVMVGNSEDETLGLIQSIGSDKIRIYQSVWDDSLREGGRVLADETNKAFAKISPDTDWAFYIQGDEVFHEDGIKTLKDAMIKYRDDKKVEGLLLNYQHFYGSFDFIGDSRRWYRKEIRVVKYNEGITSFRDAQGFRLNNRLMKVKSVDAWMYHYGWVKPPKAMQAKQETFHKLWHDDQWVKEHVAQKEEFDYSQIDSLAKFTGTHPKVMQERIARQNWKFNFDPTSKKFSFKNKILHAIENATGWRIGEYKNYKVV